ncbi:MAG: hypothetical protein MH472_01625 [Bacteroidia bacterium]|nr:hypothetical protein [Bacteroidia bacterium]
MYQLKEEEIDFILDDIRQNGIVLEDLQNNLLDHICCIIENEMEDEENFYEFYGKIMPRFFASRLAEIEEETHYLLTFKNYYAMKNTIRYSGFLSAIALMAAAIFKTMHWPGAGFLFLLGGFGFSFIFLPLLIILKFKDEEKTIDKWVFAFGFVLAMAAVVGSLFKIMHWPYANILMRGSVTVFLFGYIPLYYFTRIRRAESRFNTNINTILLVAWGGMTYALFNLHNSSKTSIMLLESLEVMEAANKQISLDNSELSKHAALKIDSNALYVSAENLIKYIQDIKLNLIAETANKPLQEASIIDASEFSSGNDKLKPTTFFEDDKHALSKAHLISELEAFNRQLDLVQTDKNGLSIPTEKLSFQSLSIIDILEQLSFIQFQVASVQNIVLRQAQQDM